MQDDGVARSPLTQENNDPIAIKSLIAVKRVAYFAVPPVGNEIAMSASSNAPEASISVFEVAKEDDVASLPSPLVKSKRLANR